MVSLPANAPDSAARGWRVARADEFQEEKCPSACVGHTSCNQTNGGLASALVQQVFGIGFPAGTTQCL